jgi:hypothetical protein
MPVIFVTPSPSVPEPPGTPFLRANFTNAASMWQETSQMTNVSGDGDDCNSIDDTGTWGGVYDTTVGGASNPPRYTLDVLNGFSGIEFDRAAQESLVSVATNPDFTLPIRWVIVGVMTGVPAGTGFPLYVANSNAGRIRLTSTAFQLQSPESKAEQNWTHSAIAFAGWCDLTTIDGEVSLSTVSGTSGPVAYANIDPTTAHVTSFGDTNGTGFNNADQIRFCEFVAWDTGSLPSIAEIESWVTSKFGVTWTA